jgi:hypothetical protein
MPASPGLSRLERSQPQVVFRHEPPLEVGHSVKGFVFPEGAFREVFPEPGKLLGECQPSPEILRSRRVLQALAVALQILADHGKLARSRQPAREKSANVEGKHKRKRDERGKHRRQREQREPQSAQHPPRGRSGHEPGGIFNDGLRESLPPGRVHQLEGRAGQLPASKGPVGINQEAPNVDPAKKRGEDARDSPNGRGTNCDCHGGNG